MINIKNFNYGTLPVLINAYQDLAKDINLEKVAKHNKLNLWAIVNLRYTYFKDTEFYNIEWDEENIKNYQEHPKIVHLYENISNMIKKHNIKILIWLGDPGILHKNFLTKLQKNTYLSFWSMDDPINSHKIIKHCAQYYDYGFTAAVNYNKTERMSDKIKSWGCQNSSYIPIGVFEGKYNIINSFEKRPYDLVFIGSVFQKRLLFMFKLKKHFGKRFLIFGGAWNGEGYTWYKKIILLLMKWYYHVPKIKKITDEELITYYQNSKIGINTHMTDGGPSAVRTYELPANGVMQICDSKNGLKEIFELNKEVIAFENNNVQDAIEKIEYYLKNEDERIEIAKNAYNKTLREYMVWHSFEKILHLIQTDKLYHQKVSQ